MEFIDISEVAEQTGVKPSALRYYEKIGLIPQVLVMDYAGNSRIMLCCG